MNDSANQDNQPQQLGMWDCTSIIIGIVIGTVIFYAPRTIYGPYGGIPNPWMGVAVWVFGGFLALMGGLCYAELATTYPRSGGDYAYLSQAYGPGTGFLFGWAQLMVIMPASIGTMAFAFADVATGMYDVTEFLAFGVSSQFIYAVGVVALLTIMNMIGVTMGKITQNILSIAKVLGLIAILVAGFFWGNASATTWENPLKENWGWGSLAIILVLYAYGGWNDAAFVAAEVRNRKRNIPFALLFGIGAITLLYVLVNLAYIFGLGFDQLGKDSADPIPTVLLKNAFGDVGGTVMNCIILASALGAANGLIFTGSRIYATLGQDHTLFGFVGHWRPGKNAPIISLLLQSAVTVGLIFLFGTREGHDLINQAVVQVRDLLNHGLAKIDPELKVKMDPKPNWEAKDAFESLFSHTAPAFWVFFLLAGFSLFILRSKNPTRERPFSVPCFPLVPFIFCNMCVYMLYQSTIYIGNRVVFVIALLVLGVPLYGLSRLIGGRPPEYKD